MNYSTHGTGSRKCVRSVSLYLVYLPYVSIVNLISISLKIQTKIPWVLVMGKMSNNYYYSPERYPFNSSIRRLQTEDGIRIHRVKVTSNCLHGNWARTQELLINNSLALHILFLFIFCIHLFIFKLSLNHFAVEFITPLNSCGNSRCTVVVVVAAAVDVLIDSLGFQVDWVQFRFFEFKVWEFRHINASAATKLLEKNKKLIRFILGEYTLHCTWHSLWPHVPIRLSILFGFPELGQPESRSCEYENKRHCIWTWRECPMGFGSWTHFDFDLYSRNLSKNSCWTGSLAFCIAGAMMPKLRRASSEAVRIPDKMVWVSICKRIKCDPN